MDIRQQIEQEMLSRETFTRKRIINLFGKENSQKVDYLIGKLRKNGLISPVRCGRDFIWFVNK